MADPRLQLRRGTQSPTAANVTTALVGEPFFDSTNDNLYVADSASTFVHIGGASYTSRIDAFLTSATTTVGAQVVLKEGTTNGSDTVTIKSPNTLAASYTLTLPGNDGDSGQFLTTDGSGILSWTTASINSFTTFSVSGQSDVVADQAGDTVTFAEGEGIDITTNATTDTITISAELATTTNPGVASFNSSDFAVSVGGEVTLAANSVALGTDTTGNYVADVTAGAGLTKTSSAGEGQTVDLAIGAGTGIAVNADDVALNFNGLTTIALADADQFAFYDASGTTHGKASADAVRDYVLGGVSGDISIDASGVATIAANSVALGTDTTGNFVGDVTAGAGLTKTSSAGENQTVDLAIGAGEGITVNADDVALKNGTNLSDATVMGWDNTNNQLTNAPITYTGNDVAITGDLTVTGNDIKSSGGTTAITLSGANVTIAGDLTVSGATTTLNTTTLSVEDRIIELGLVNGAAPTGATTWDSAVAFNYFATTAKKSAIVWVDNAGFELAATLNAEDNSGAASAQPQISAASYASLGLASLYIGSIGTATNEVINSSKQVINVTIDCGTY